MTQDSATIKMWFEDADLMEGGRIMQELILAAIIKIEDEHILEVIYAFITELISDEGIGPNFGVGLLHECGST